MFETLRGAFETLRGALTPPPLPPWEGMHVVIVHFPEALLVFAPIFVLLATVLPIRCRWASWAALIVLAGGAAGASLAVLSGGWAENVAADGSDEMYKVMEQHKELAALTRNVYLGITALYAVAVVLPAIFKRLNVPRYLVPMNIIFLLLLAFGCLLLANTGHLGGRLVHEFGVKAIMDKSQLVEPAVKEAGDKDNADNDAPEKSSAESKALTKSSGERKLAEKK